MHLLEFLHTRTPSVKLQLHYKHAHITVYKALCALHTAHYGNTAEGDGLPKDQLLQRAHRNDVLLQPLVAAVIVMGTTGKVRWCYPYVLVQYIND